MKSPACRATTYQFGVFEFDPSSGELRKNGLKVRLNQQSAKLLALLLRSEGKLCTREELQRELWPADTFVDFEHSLNKAVWGLRQALGDFVASPRYIETVAGQGYRFLAVAQHSGQPASAPKKQRNLESLAVLPPLNAAGTDDCTFLACQVASRLTTKLCGGKLRVLAYSAVKQHTGLGHNPCSVGRDLGVQSVLAGEILQRNGDVIINLELIDTTDGTQIWGTQLKEAWPQAADRAEQIADEIVRQLQSTVARTEKRSKSEIRGKRPPRPITLEINRPLAPHPPILSKKALLFG